MSPGPGPVLDHEGLSEIPAKVEEIYTVASAIDLVNAAITQEVVDSCQGSEPLTPPGISPSPRYDLLTSLRTALTTGEAEIEVPDSLDKAGQWEAISILHHMGKTEQDIRGQLDQPQFVDSLDETFKQLEEHDPSIVLHQGGHVKAVGRIDWDKTEGMAPLEEEEFGMLVERMSNPGRNDGAANLAIIEAYPEEMKRWVGANFQAGTAAVYKTMASIARRMEQRHRYTSYSEAHAYLVGADRVREIGERLLQAQEYEPTEFCLPVDELSLLRQSDFEMDEVYDIAQKPELRDRIFNTKPWESDPELPEADEPDEPTDSDKPRRKEVNVLEYFDYLIKTGGSFAPGSTRILEKKLRDEYDHNNSFFYNHAVGLWSSWRSQKGYSTQSVLDAWTIADATLPKPN